MKKNRKQNACNLLTSAMAVVLLAITMLIPSNYWPVRFEVSRMFMVRLILLTQLIILATINSYYIWVFLKKWVSRRKLKREEYRYLTDFKKYFQTYNVFIQRDIPIKSFNKSIVEYWKTFKKSYNNLFTFSDDENLYIYNENRYVPLTAFYGWELFDLAKSAGMNSITVIMYYKYDLTDPETLLERPYRKLVILTDSNVKFSDAQAPLGQIIDKVEVKYIPKVPVRK